MRERLMILGAGIMQVPVIRKAEDMGFETIVVDYDEKAPGFNYASKKYLISTLDQDAVLEVAKLEKVSGILTTSDAPVRVVARVGKELGLPAMTERVSNICTNKFLQRTLFKENGINCPQFYLCDKDFEFDSLESFPYIIKPVDSSASRGVRKVDNISDLMKAAKDAFSFSNKGLIIIESFISGREFSVETLTQNNETHIITITEKITKGENLGYFVEDTHIQPARLSDQEKKIIENELLRAIKIIGINNCATHTEIKINSEGAYIIEIACRLGGDYITSDLVPLSTGVDMLGNLINISVGKTINTKRLYDKSSCVQFLNTENYYKCVEYVQHNMNKIIRYEINPFDDKPIKNSMDRLGYIILQENNINQIEEDLRKLN